MDEDLGHHGGLFDDGNERQGAAALRTVCHVDLKHPFEQLSPAQPGLPQSLAQLGQRRFRCGLGPPGTAWSRRDAAGRCVIARPDRMPSSAVCLAG